MTHTTIALYASRWWRKIWLHQGTNYSVYEHLVLTTDTKVIPLPDTFIQSDLQYMQAIHFFVSICVPWELNPQLLRCWCNALTTEPQEQRSNQILRDTVHHRVMCALLCVDWNKFVWITFLFLENYFIFLICCIRAGQGCTLVTHDTNAQLYVSFLHQTW